MLLTYEDMDQNALGTAFVAETLSLLCKVISIISALGLLLMYNSFGNFLKIRALLISW